MAVRGTLVVETAMLHQMGHGRRKKMSREQARLHGIAAAAEQLANSRIQPQRGLLAKGGSTRRLGHPAPLRRKTPTARQKQVLAEILRNSRLA